MGKIDEARAAQEAAVELAADANFLAALKAIERIRARFPDLGIQIGMASELVLGMHGELEYDGVRLAGLWPREQMTLAAKAGVTIFGPAINVNTGKPVAGNVARTITITIVKQCCEESTEPVHLSGGMGVGGVPMHVLPPGDAASRASRSAVDILRFDGLQVGAGDVYGQAISHGVATGMGGIRTAGDLVARMQIPWGMRLKQAKEYVAQKLGVSVRDLSDPVVILDVRKERGLGASTEAGEIIYVDDPVGLEAKLHIAELLDIAVSFVERFKAMTGGRG